MFLTCGVLNSANGQDTTIVRALPEASPSVPYYQGSDANQNPSQLDQPVRPNQQGSPSDTLVQERANDLKEQQRLDSQALIDQLEDPTISSLFEQGRWPRKTIRAISLDIREKSDRAPQDVATKLLDSQSGRWSSFAPAPKVYAWAAPNIRYQPLYFEDVALERYGQTKSPGRQAVRSGVHFFTSVGLLPWHLCQDPPQSCDYPLGFCRPGDDVPCTDQKLFYHHAEK